jgi:hypothetical protein
MRCYECKEAIVSVREAVPSDGKYFCKTACVNAYRRRTGKPTLKIVAALFGLVLFTSAAHAGPWDDAPAEVKKWFTDQVDSEGNGCCGLGDAPPVELRKNDVHYTFLWNGVWYPIPQTKIEFVEDTPVGRPVVFFDLQTMHIYCAKLIRPRI